MKHFLLSFIVFTLFACKGTEHPTTDAEALKFVKDLSLNMESGTKPSCTGQPDHEGWEECSVSLPDAAREGKFAINVIKCGAPRTVDGCVNDGTGCKF